jgi:sensor domain CHASE-containing protein
MIKRGTSIADGMTLGTVIMAAAIIATIITMGVDMSAIRQSQADAGLAQARVQTVEGLLRIKSAEIVKLDAEIVTKDAEIVTKNAEIESLK